LTQQASKHSIKQISEHNSSSSTAYSVRAVFQKVYRL